MKITNREGRGGCRWIENITVKGVGALALADGDPRRSTESRKMVSWHGRPRRGSGVSAENAEEMGVAVGDAACSEEVVDEP